MISYRFSFKFAECRVAYVGVIFVSMAVPRVFDVIYIDELEKVV